MARQFGWLFMVAFLLLAGGCGRGPLGATALPEPAQPAAQAQVAADAPPRESEVDRWRAEANRTFAAEELRPWREIGRIDGSTSSDEWSEPVTAADVTIRIFGTTEAQQTLLVEVEKNGESCGVFKWPLPPNFTTDGKFYASRPGDAFRFKVQSQPEKPWSLIVQSK